MADQPVNISDARAWQIPDVRFHIETDSGFYAYDRHSASDSPFFVPWGDAFICSWDSQLKAAQYLRFVSKLPGARLRFSMDGELVPLTWKTAGLTGESE